MGKEWDGLDENGVGIAFNVEVWKEAYRVLKPGGYCMAFSGSRTYHRMAVAIEDAGFEIKDMIEWVYGSGFPKALDISKALDKKLGKEREIIKKEGKVFTGSNNNITGVSGIYETVSNNAISDLAKQYEGYKTQLKPAHEPICLAMKPLSEKTFTENVMKWGTGGLNIDGTRIPTTENLGREIYQTQSWKNTSKLGVGSVNDDWKKGRYPANFIIHKDVAPVLDKQSKEASRYFYNAKIEEEDYIPFCYTAKASKKERNSDTKGQVHNNMNNHATVKPKSILT